LRELVDFFLLSYYLLTERTDLCYLFSPYLVREGEAKADIMSEEFEPTLGYFRIVLRCRGGGVGAREPLKIRFHGQTFSRGRFEIDVKGDAEWKVEFDRPAEGSEGNASPSGELFRGRHRFSLPPNPNPVSTPASAPSDAPHLVTSATPTPPAAAVAAEETWRLAGSRGGCTLLVYATPANGLDKNGVVQVTIERREELARTARDRVKLTSRAFGVAVERAGEESSYERGPHAALRAAREVWRTLRLEGLADPLAAPAPSWEASEKDKTTPPGGEERRCV
jgi:hypothetical protein